MFRDHPVKFSRAFDGTILVQHAPQLELLKRASVCITHDDLSSQTTSVMR
jgi:hypothetical protein